MPPIVRDLACLIAGLTDAAPGLAETMRAQGTPPQPDPEVPVSWMGDVGLALAEVLPTLVPARATAVMSLVEDRLVHGSETMRAAVATGLLEALVGRVSAGQLDGAVVAGALGPASRAHVDAWDAFTLGRPSLPPT